MRRKNKKVAKIVSDKPSTSSTDSEIIISDNSNSNKTDLTTNDFKSLKTEENSSIDSTDLLNQTACNNDQTYLCLELKMISIDQNCIGYRKLTEPFLCVSSGALVDHVTRLIYKKMTISEELFEVLAQNL